jgi:hypothetical protein
MQNRHCLLQDILYTQIISNELTRRLAETRGGDEKMTNHQNRGRWQYTRNHRFATRSSQAAKALGVKLASQIFEPQSVYGARQWSSEVWALVGGATLVISGDKFGFDTAVLSEFETPCTAYGRESEQVAIADAAGLAH